jgi:hypothetical protein
MKQQVHGVTQFSTRLHPCRPGALTPFRARLQTQPPYHHPLRLERMARGGPAQRNALVPTGSQPEPETLAPTAGYPAR